MSHPRIGAIITALSAIRNRFHREANLQAEVARVLTGLGVHHEAEAILDKENRIDFLLGYSLGIECKVSWGPAAIDRQIYRYAEHLAEIILITTKPGPTNCIGEIRNSRGETVIVRLIETWKNPS